MCHAQLLALALSSNAVTAKDGGKSHGEFKHDPASVACLFGRGTPERKGNPIPRGSNLDAGAVVLVHAHWAVTPFLTPIREAVHLAGEVGAAVGTPFFLQAFPVQTTHRAAHL